MWALKFNDHEVELLLRAIKGYVSEWSGAMPDAEEKAMEQLAAKIKGSSGDQD